MTSHYKAVERASDVDYTDITYVTNRSNTRIE
jgi:hypothetical protein